ncbi:MAG: hypothetical protein LBV47_06780, partial [Bacteroidales bacterium]|nr:hypothetical protein [Bacteroidales bacterium]
MKATKILFFAYCMLQMFSTAAQQQVSIEEARRAAAQSLNLRHGKEAAYSETKVKKVNIRKGDMEKTLMYEVVFDDSQGVLLSGSKA